MEESEFKQHIKNTFNMVAEGYECDAMVFFKKSADLLPKHFALNGSEHVLDVASGTGIAAYSIAKHLPSGKVTAIDFSEGMLNQAKNKFKKHHQLNIELQQMDMGELAFSDNTFDAANCSFGIFFVEDMQAQLSHIIQKVKPGGKVICCAFYDTAFLPSVDLFLDYIHKEIVEST